MTALAPPRLLFLDLRQQGDGAMPPLDGLEPISPSLSNNCDKASNALAVLVAIDGEAAYLDWRKRLHPLCPRAFPHVILLDPYAPQLARKVMADDAADCCAIDDIERMQLIAARLERRRDPDSEAGREASEAMLYVRMQTAVDMLPSPLFMKDRNGRYIACNKAFEDYIGLPREAIIGATVFDVAPADLARVYQQADQELMAQGGRQTYEAQVRYADGSYHDVIFYKSVFHAANGEADGISGTMLDISERKQLEKQLEIAASTDFLTGINNLRTFYELAGQEFRRFSRNGGDLSLIVIDLDHFKQTNDQLGHAAGDEALRQFVAAVQANLREQDIFARAGGDEFRLLLPGTNLAGAVLVAERIRQAVSRLQVSSPGGSVLLSISAGVCACQADDESLDTVIRRADGELYRAKAAGRNRVCSPQTPQ
ncbi:MAG TPA: diguanylate cyclase [Azonexus sp.]|nr:diguanylate cyclase [Azonexus sp.]